MNELKKAEKKHLEINTEQSRKWYLEVKSEIEKVIFLIQFFDACNNEHKREGFLTSNAKM